MSKRIGVILSSTILAAGLIAISSTADARPNRGRRARPAPVKQDRGYDRIPDRRRARRQPPRQSRPSVNVWALRNIEADFDRAVRQRDRWAARDANRRLVRWIDGALTQVRRNDFRRELIHAKRDLMRRPHRYGRRAPWRAKQRIMRRLVETTERYAYQPLPERRQRARYARARRW